MYKFHCSLCLEHLKGLLFQQFSVPLLLHWDLQEDIFKVVAKGGKIGLLNNEVSKPVIKFSKLPTPPKSWNPK